MKKLVLTALICFLFGIVYSQKKTLDNTFYAFNNSMRMSKAPAGMEAQAELIKRLGFDGFSGHTNDDYFLRRKALDAAGLKMPEIYWGIDMDSTGRISFKEGLKEIIKDSKDRDLVIALSGSGNSENVIRAVKYANTHEGVTLGICGYRGGKLKNLAQHVVWVDVDDMQLTEDVHFIFGHMVMQRLARMPV